VSRDREFDSSNEPNRASNIRFRTQSPSNTTRRSRERERTDRDQMKEFNTSLNQSADLGMDSETFEDSRMTEELLLNFPSLTSDEVEAEGDAGRHQQQQQSSSTSSRGHNRTNSLQAIDRLITKIACTKESIRKEQTARDGECQ
jgi:hypothetical protein